MGVAWKAFKVFLMVLGSITFAVLSAIIVYNVVVAASIYSRLKDCDGRIDRGVCSSLKTQKFFLESLGYEFENVSMVERIGQLSYVTSNLDGHPLVETTFVFFAEEPARLESSSKSYSKDEVAKKLVIGLEKRIRDAVCSEQEAVGFIEMFGRDDFSALEQSNGYKSFLDAGGVLSFKIGITNDDHLSSYEFSRSAIARAEESGKSVSEIAARAKENGVGFELEPFHFATDPITITSCEDKP